MEFENGEALSQWLIRENSFPPCRGTTPSRRSFHVTFAASDEADEDG